MLAIVLLMMVAGAVSFHFWLLAHAKSILTEFVNSQSNGMYRLQIKKVKYNYLKLKLELDHPFLTSTASDQNNDKFELGADMVSMKLEKLWPLIANRQLLIDSILMDRPLLKLEKQKRNNDRKPLTSFSLSSEMEKAYQSIKSVLNTLKVGNFRINKGAFAMRFPAVKNSPPLLINNIDFFIKGLNIDSSITSHNPNSFTDDIQLKIAGQTIQFPDGSKSVKFSSFYFVANKGNLEVDSCSITGAETDSTNASFNLFAEKMRIKNVYLASNDTNSYNRIDSLFFTRPKVSFSVQLKEANKDSSETISNALRRITSAAFGKLLVRYASINNVVFDVDVERKEKLSTFDFVQDSLEVSNLGLGLFPSMPISASNIRFGVKEFVDYFRDSTYLVHFDSVRINNDQFSLFNFNIESTTRVKKGNQKIFIPVLQIQGIDWFEVISQKRLVASNLILNDPSISIVGAGNSKNSIAKKNVDLDQLFNQAFTLKNIKVLNGKVRYTFPGSGYMQVKQINTILTPDLFTKDYFSSIPKVVKQFNTGELIYHNNGWNIQASNVVYGNNSSLAASAIDLTNDEKNVRVKAVDVNINGISGKPKTNLLNIGKISWTKANIDLNLSQSEQVKTKSILKLGLVSGGATAFNLTKDKIAVNSKLSAIKTGDVTIENGRPTSLTDFFANGSSLDIVSGDTKFHSGNFAINNNQGSAFSALTATLPLNKQSVKLEVPEVAFTINLQQSLSGYVDISDLKIIQPKLTIKSNSDRAQVENERAKLFPFLDIKNIMVTDPLISLENGMEEEPVQLQLGKSFLSVAGIKSNDEGTQLKFVEVKAQSNELAIRRKDSLNIFSTSGIAKLDLKEFILYTQPIAEDGKWKLSNGSMDLSNITLLNKRKIIGVDTLQLSSLHAANFSVNEKTIRSASEYMNTIPQTVFSDVSFVYKNAKNVFQVNGLKADLNNLSMNSFTFHPQISNRDFVKAQQYQKDYITVRTGPVQLNNYSIASWLNDSIVKIAHLQISDAVLNDTRDKHLPLEPNVIKGLPVTLLKNLPFKTMIDTVSVNNADVRYHEVSDKSNRAGTIRFARIHATIENLKNYDFSQKDSLRVVASGYLMDKALVRMRLSEAYQDSLAGFNLSVRANPFDLKILNPFLLPLVSIRIKSGFTDSLQLRAVAQEYIAVGDMRFFYHDLKVEFLKGGEEQKKTFLTGLLSFAANSFVIKTNNRDRLGKVFYERSRNRSFFNYLVKIIASGGASSIGAERSKKYNRLYNNKIKETRLPDREF